MRIIRDRRIVEDAWIHLDDEAPAPAGADVTVSLPRWQRERDALRAREGRVGVRLRPDEEPSALADDLPDLALVAIEFPKFTDGRGYSKARLLRSRWRFTGELRAVGNVLRDQLYYMHRCGIDAFELQPGKSLEQALGAFDELSVTYQAAADDPRPLFRRLRRAPA
jgi:uncharacterized protein (DUF934 family)